MRNWLSSRSWICRASALMLGFAPAIFAAAEISTPARGESATKIVNLRASGHSKLQHLLHVATSAVPETTARAGNVGDGSVAAAGDEVFWDGFELCGDGVIDAGSEQCDRSDLGGATCLAAGFTDGTVTCDATCHIDTSLCTGACPATCAIDADCGVCGPCLQLGGGVGLCLH